MIKSLVKEMFEIPDTIRELTAGRWEIEKQMLNCRDDEETARLEENLSCIDRELEWLRSRLTAAVTTVNLLTSLTGTGKMEEIKAIGELISKELHEWREKQQKEQENKKDATNSTKQQKEDNAISGKDANKNQSKDKDELKTGVFLVNETKPGKKEDTVWATVVDEDGKGFLICGQNGKGKTLHEAVDKKVKVKYRHLEAKKLFAVVVELIDKN